MSLNNFIFLLMAVHCLEYVESAVSATEVPGVHETGVMVKEEPRKKQQDGLMSRILPMLATPFIMQVTILPLVLMGMKFMLLSSMFLGKLGILLWGIVLIHNRNNYGGGLYSHNINVDHNDHMGHSNYAKDYQYSDHYNYRRRRRRRDVVL
ncbi:uncharacterized protein LOC108906954 [Anoplophora glabripennis]|uniref:uncharacterized protein LOC108906954 n=1 Tax=Anoplophora glabripennis TaxID=217634 RepID=UPI0008752849|nr:uncharacterized protein LOC108906954 [Anoplophora glabripennis]